MVKHCFSVFRLVKTIFIEDLEALLSLILSLLKLWLLFIFYIGALLLLFFFMFEVGVKAFNLAAKSYIGILRDLCLGGELCQYKDQQSYAKTVHTRVCQHYLSILILNI